MSEHLAPLGLTIEEILEWIASFIMQTQNKINSAAEQLKVLERDLRDTKVRLTRAEKVSSMRVGFLNAKKETIEAIMMTYSDYINYQFSRLDLLDVLKHIVDTQILG